MAHKRNVFIAFGVSILGQAVGALTLSPRRSFVDDVIINHRRSLAPWLALLIGAGVFGFAACVRAPLRRRAREPRRAVRPAQRGVRAATASRLREPRPDAHRAARVARANSDVGLLQGLLMFMPIMLGNFVFLLMALAVMVKLSAPLTLVALLALPLLLFVTLRLRTTIFPASWDAQQRAGEVAGVVDETSPVFGWLKGFGQEDRELSHLADTAQDLFRARCASSGCRRATRRCCRRSPCSRRSPSSRSVVGSRSTATSRSARSSRSRVHGAAVSPIRQFAVLIAVGQQARAGPNASSTCSTPTRRSSSATTPSPCRWCRARCASTTCGSATRRATPCSTGSR